ncbi:uncharacterized protein LOC114188322 [Vigna unguiculata]|uniref:uncharacterized protein LOC114188322 n=1 Tax=Vigna unguiculata TaxID=3917 RepID=UPI001016F3B6|nr:uncharacterized protein LOC114188322 [Vigna unguiculata]
MGGWSEVLPLVEFTYNNSYHSSIEFLQQTFEKVKTIQERMRATQSRQKSYADKRRRPLEFEAGDHVFLRVTLTADPSHILESDDIQIREDLTVTIRPVQILDSQVKKL